MDVRLRDHQTMSRKSNSASTDVTMETVLKEFKANSKPMTPERIARMREAGAELERDAEFTASVLKSQFVEGILRAMEEQGISQAELAKRVSKSPQYLSKILNERTNANFTIDTMAQIAAALNWKLHIRLVSPDETLRIESRKVVKPAKLAVRSPALKRAVG